MLRFLNKITKKRTSPSLELVSIHIPKTAGTSFRYSLYHIYGERRVLRLDIKEDGSVYFNEKKTDAPQIPNDISVIHGHFSYERLEEKFPEVKGVKVITWLREPSERVVSNYHYLSQIWQQQFKGNEDLKTGMMSLHRSLLEYAQHPNNRNKISRFLKGTTLEKLFFIGFVEQYETDLKTLAQKLDWKDAHFFDFNKTRKPTRAENSVTLERIKALNEADYEIYELAKKIRTELSAD